MTLASVLHGKRLVICGGPGGVGKTTSSAAVALGMAAAGARVAVITIDPAKRLANALGLHELHNDPVRVSLDRVRTNGAGVGGELWAMALDPKRTFDELIDHVAPDAERAAQIKSNRIYNELSNAISGSQEFTAVSKLFDLERAGHFDVLVLDTPPSRNALDFLHAPRRLSAFLDGRALRLLMRPTGLGMRVLARGASPVVAAVSHLSGGDVLADTSSFFRLLGEMTDDFSDRAAGVDRMLRAPTTAFLLVTSAEPHPVDETVLFGRTLVDGGLPFAGIVVNRVHEPLGRRPKASRSDVATLLAHRVSPELASRVAASAEAYQSLARSDALATARLRRAFPAEPIVTIPHLPRDVHDIDALWEIHAHLFQARAHIRASPRRTG
jgi:anion-transporting  ArsA/GET3 family ATPase